VLGAVRNPAGRSPWAFKRNRMARKVVGVMVQRGRMKKRFLCMRMPEGWRCGLCKVGTVRARGRSRCKHCLAVVMSVEYELTNPMRDLAFLL
jgi:hypothetical protein